MGITIFAPPAGETTQNIFGIEGSMKKRNLVKKTVT